MTAISKRPNFIVIVADDLGFTDTSAFGGEINTPNLNKLAQRGLRFTDFHTASACSPTRSMLLSGTDNHIAGLGQMREFINRIPEKFADKPGYEGYLNFRIAALPEILKEAGYYNFISGKWHLGFSEEHWPDKRGFHKSFTLIPGAGNHYKYYPKDEDGHLKFMTPIFESDGRKIDPDKEIPDDFYSTDYFTEKFLSFLDSEEREDRPFLGLLTYTAPHWPYQAPQEVIEKYKGVYDDGPRKLRERRLKDAIKLGIIPEGIDPHAVETHKDSAWDDLTPEEQQTEAKIMEIYAAMVEIMDTNIGKVLDRVEELGELDNTFIVFMSDNGAEGMLMEAMATVSQNFQYFISKYYNNAYDNLGNKDSFVWYSEEWAQAATAPYYMYKMWASEGGIRCPLIVSHPDLIPEEDNGGIKDGFVTVMDILPTILELANVKHPAPDFQGRQVATVRGSSWVDYLSHNSDQVHNDDKIIGWELFAQQAIRKGKYKALYIPKPLGSDKWQLFNIRTDPGETTDLADENPEVLAEMINYWSEYVAETGLVEVTDVFYDRVKMEYETKRLY